MQDRARLEPFRMRPWLSPRPWGTDDLRPWYDLDASKAEKIGEVWLTGDEAVIETGELAGKTLAQAAAEHPDALGIHRGRFPLLTKMLFPHDKLSVQVHPDDEMAQRLHGTPTGKTECWYVLEAKPGAHVALGLKREVSEAEMRRAVAEETVEELLRMVPVEQGDMLFVDAGTVHAIYPGCVLFETQQNSDWTYRMYDYGRGRELHLEQGLAAMRSKTRAGKVKPVMQGGGSSRLIAEQYFAGEKFSLRAGEQAAAAVASAKAADAVPKVLFVSAGECTLRTDAGEFGLRMGQAAVVPAGSVAWSLAAVTDSELLCVWPAA